MATTKSKAKTKKKAPKKAPKKAAPKKQTKKPSRARAVLAPAPTSPATRRDAIRDLMGQVNEPGHKVMAFADEAPTTYKLRRPFGIMQLDIDTGGGAPAGGLTALTGPDNAGKTYLMYLLMAFHQRLYGHNASMFFAATEGGFDIEAARTFGVRVAYPDAMIYEWSENRRLLNLPPFTKEELLWLKDEVGVVTVIQGDTGEEILDTVLNCVRSGLFHLGFVDSMSNLMPEADADKDLSQAEKRAARAGLETRFIKQYMPITNTLDGRNFTSLIIAQQVRANQERASAPSNMQKYIKRWVSTGAWAIRHGKLLDVCITSGEKIRRTRNSVESIAGKHMKWELLKGKAGTHDNISGEARFFYPPYFGQGVDLHDSVIMTGMRHGVLYETETGRVSMKTAAGKAMVIAPNLKHLPKLMQIDFEFEMAIRREILAARGINCLYQ